MTTPGCPVPGGCVRGGCQTALPRRRRAAATISTRTQRALPCCRAGRPPARPGARAGRIGTSARLAPRTPWTTRRHSNWCRASRAGGSARYVDGTRRLPISPLIDTYLVPEAPQGARSDPIPPLATTSAIGHVESVFVVKKKKNSVRTDRPTPGTLALIGDSRASLSHIVGWVDHTGGHS